VVVDRLWKKTWKKTNQTRWWKRKYNPEKISTTATLVSKAISGVWPVGQPCFQGLVLGKGWPKKNKAALEGVSVKKKGRTGTKNQGPV